eukprot:gene41704-36878_t
MPSPHARAARGVRIPSFCLLVAARCRRTSGLGHQQVGPLKSKRSTQTMLRSRPSPPRRQAYNDRPNASDPVLDAVAE